ncbi:MAG: hypothetical protein IJK43_01185 [Prevotella sp.]|nr:hypothetical protein [Prevotella sp.]
MEQPIEHSPWSENIIIADADYADRVAFNLIVNFERMIGRRIPQADMAQWLVCIALDGGLRTPSDTHVVLLHNRDRSRLENFTPSQFDTELNGQAFRDDQLGEFTISAVTAEDQLVSHDDLLLDIVGTALQQPEVKRVMIVPNAEEGTLYDDLRETLRCQDADDKRVTVFTMEPLQGGNFRQEMLGYSLMAALGIRSDELANS